MNFYAYIINENDIILSALKKIDNNNKGFLIVIDDSEVVKGTLTDGDIRRAFIKGYTVNSTITTVYNQDYVYIDKYEEFDEVINIFKSPKINFLPILDNSNLVNIITKKQLHFALIEDIKFDLSFDFFSLDKLKSEHEVYNRPWGFYKTTFLNPYSRAKIINVYPREELSLQEHKKREEHWIVITGKGKLTLGESEKYVNPGDYVFIPKGCKHKVINISNKDSLMISEVQLGEYFGEDDIIRYEDKYGRVEYGNK